MAATQLLLLRKVGTTIRATNRRVYNLTDFCPILQMAAIFAMHIRLSKLPCCKIHDDAGQLK